jgi:hypothetical protein
MNSTALHHANPVSLWQGMDSCPRDPYAYTGCGQGSAMVQQYNTMLLSHTRLLWNSENAFIPMLLIPSVLQFRVTFNFMYTCYCIVKMGWISSALEGS